MPEQAPLNPNDDQDKQPRSPENQAPDQDPLQSEPLQQDSIQPDPLHTDPIQTDPLQAEPANLDPLQPEFKIDPSNQPGRITPDDLAAAPKPNIQKPDEAVKGEIGTLKPINPPSPPKIFTTEEKQQIATSLVNIANEVEKIKSLGVDPKKIEQVLNTVDFLTEKEPISSLTPRDEWYTCCCCVVDACVERAVTADWPDFILVEDPVTKELNIVEQQVYGHEFIIRVELDFTSKGQSKKKERCSLGWEEWSNMGIKGRKEVKGRWFDRVFEEIKDPRFTNWRILMNKIEGCDDGTTKETLTFITTSRLALVPGVANFLFYQWEIRFASAAACSKCPEPDQHKFTATQILCNIGEVILMQEFDFTMKRCKRAANMKAQAVKMNPGPSALAPEREPAALHTREGILNWLRELPPLHPMELNSYTPEKETNIPVRSFSYEEWIEAGRIAEQTLMREVLRTILQSGAWMSEVPLTIQALYAVGWMEFQHDDEIIRLVGEHLKTDDELQKIHAMGALARLKAMDYFSLIRDQLLDPTMDLNLRINAAVSIHELGHPEATAVLESMLNDPESKLRLFINALLDRK